MPEPLTILITGSRGWTEWERIETAILDAVESHFRNSTGRVVIADVASFVTIRHGGAEGADSWAELVGRRYGFKTDVHRPDYDNLPSKIAPLRRNDKMVELGADVCLAFRLNASRGTTYTIDKAMAAGIHTIVHESPQRERLF